VSLGHWPITKAKGRRSSRAYLSLFKRKPSLDDPGLGSVVPADLVIYGIVMFTPTILSSVTAGSKVPELRTPSITTFGAKGSAWIDCCSSWVPSRPLPGDRVGRITLQIWGFNRCAVGLGPGRASIRLVHRKKLEDGGLMAGRLTERARLRRLRGA